MSENTGKFINTDELLDSVLFIRYGELTSRGKQLIELTQRLDEILCDRAQANRYVAAATITPNTGSIMIGPVCVYDSENMPEVGEEEADDIDDLTVARCLKVYQYELACLATVLEA